MCRMLQASYQHPRAPGYNVQLLSLRTRPGTTNKEIDFGLEHLNGDTGMSIAPNPSHFITLYTWIKILGLHNRQTR
jgi:hypothetical protein